MTPPSTASGAALADGAAGEGEAGDGEAGDGEAGEDGAVERVGGAGGEHGVAEGDESSWVDMVVQNGRRNSMQQRYKGKQS